MIVLVRSLCCIRSSWWQQVTGPGSKNPGKWSCCSGGIWCLGEKPRPCLSASCNHRLFLALPFPAQDLPGLPGGSRYLILPAPGTSASWRALAGWGWQHGRPRRAGLKPAACTCLSSAGGQRRAPSGSLRGITAATFFPVPANPFFPGLPFCYLSPVLPPVD